MSERKHGEYDPEHGGWYSAVTRAWHSDPTKIGQFQTAPPISEYARQQHAQMYDKSFKPDPEMESLIRLRSSDLPEERQSFNDIATGTTRIQLHDYEKAKAEGDK